MSHLHDAQVEARLHSGSEEAAWVVVNVITSAFPVEEEGDNGFLTDLRTGTADGWIRTVNGSASIHSEGRAELATAEAGTILVELRATRFAYVDTVAAELKRHFRCEERARLNDRDLALLACTVTPSRRPQ